MTQLIPWENASMEELSQVRGVCLDIDDTLSTQGKLTAEAYAALWALKSSGYRVVPITGRPAGWCDHFARFWPVDAVVGENGGFSFFMKNGKRERLTTPQAPKNPKPQIETLAQEVLRAFPHARWASDQAYREYDLAIDFCEDVPAWPRAEVNRLVALCEGLGAHAKVSSIHVNAWFGDYDKYSGFTHLLQSPAFEQALGQTPPGLSEWLFIGDSPNDEPLFQRFSLSVGVANLRDFVDRLRHPPRYLTSQPSGLGFCQMARTLVQVAAARSK
ncbi:MAG: HAD-IIB family hydrolase [Bdellovibrionales bacterium]|nr:HAD-IIB family hydrolase [Bdellovibrionales bacterium]